MRTIATLAAAGLAVGLAATLPAGAATAATAATSTPHVTKVLVVMEENHSTAQMESGMPYLNSLGKKYGQATDYVAVTHPSEPNYIAIAAGSTMGITDDGYATVNAKHGQSVFGQAVAKGKTSGTYAQSQPANCTLTGNVDKGWAVKHVPQAYFLDERTHCKATDTSTADFLTDAKANRLPNIGFLIPNKCYDAHDCSLATADGYLKAKLPTVLASSDFTSGRLAVVVTADEDDKQSGNRVYTVVLQAGLSHKTVSSKLTHYSLSRLLSQTVGAAPLRNAATAPNMASAFGLTVGPAN